MNKNFSGDLTDFEKWVLFQKGTEAPFSGLHCHNQESGRYFCRACRSQLFTSEDKFVSHCGWPSFDEALSGAVRESPDADGRRTEITCANCHAHLGHVFQGEEFTPKNKRFCVNSVSLGFTPVQPLVHETAVFASGCFWGTEYFMAKMHGVLSSQVGYTGGTLPEPSYKDVCRGNTGHFEAVKITYDPVIVSFQALLKLFFETHDFSQTDGQGPDKGSQYLSAIFVDTIQERHIVAETISQLISMGFAVATQVMPRFQFWPAEPEHQKYYFKHQKTPYCHSLRQIFPHS